MFNEKCAKLQMKKIARTQIFTLQVIFNMYMQVPVEVREIKQKLKHIMTTSLDMFFGKKHP